MKPERLFILLAALTAAGGPALAASGFRPVPIEERARGASQVLVATVAKTTARMETNEFGDELIITYAQLAIEEVLKGSASPVTVAIEGGTLNGLTLRVSDLPALNAGERAVFFLSPGRRGEFLPHLRGQGILKLDEQGRVRNSSLTLDEIRRLTIVAGQRGGK